MLSQSGFQQPIPAVPRGFVCIFSTRLILLRLAYFHITPSLIISLLMTCWSISSTHSCWPYWPSGRIEPPILLLHVSRAYDLHQLWMSSIALLPIPPKLSSSGLELPTTPETSPFAYCRKLPQFPFSSRAYKCS